MSEELKSAFESMAARGQPAGGAAVVQRALDLSVPAMPRRSSRRFLVLATAVTMLTVAVVAGGTAFVRSRTGRIERVDVASALDGPGNARQMTVLLVGSDARDGIEGERADALMLVRVDQDQDTVAVLSVPRDLYVASEQTRIASLLSSDPAALLRAVQDTTGLAVDHYVQVEFDGFRRAIDAVGGVKLAVPVAVRDRLSGLALPAGCQSLDGDAALAFARSRHLEVLALTGRYVPDPTGDLGRIERQQQLLLSAVNQVVDKLDRNVLTTARVVDAVVDNVTTDTGFSTSAMLRFAAKLADPPQLAALTVPTRALSVDGAAVLETDRTAFRAVLDLFRGVTKVPPALEDATSADADCT